MEVGSTRRSGDGDVDQSDLVDCNNPCTSWRFRMSFIVDMIHIQRHIASSPRTTHHGLETRPLCLQSSPAGLATVPEGPMASLQRFAAVLERERLAQRCTFLPSAIITFFAPA